MVQFCGAVKLTIFLFFVLKLIAADELILDRFELRNESYVPGFYNISVMRVGKFNRTAYVFNGNAELFIDVGNDYEAEVSFHFNRLNNNQYQKSPMRVPKMKFCDVVEKYYTVLMTDEMKTKTNFPEVKSGEKWCPLKKGYYWAKNLALDASRCPALFTEGYWKIEMRLYKENQVLVVAHLYLRKESSGIMG